MKKSLTFIKNKLALLLAITLATIVGGVTTAAVLAAIPDSGGVIHGCYKNNNGSLKIIDSSTQTCSNGETGLNWSQSGGGGSVVLHDANGQVLGDLLDIGTGGAGEVYNHVLNRIINFSNVNPFTVTVTGAFYQSGDCSGQSYAGNDPGAKTALRRINTSQYGIVSDNAQIQTITYNSVLSYDGASFVCDTIDPGTTDMYPLTNVSLPFSIPIALPLKF